MAELWSPSRVLPLFPATCSPAKHHTGPADHSSPQSGSPHSLSYPLRSPPCGSTHIPVTSTQSPQDKATQRGAPQCWAAPLAAQTGSAHSPPIALCTLSGRSLYSHLETPNPQFLHSFRHSFTHRPHIARSVLQTVTVYMYSSPIAPHTSLQRPPPTPSLLQYLRTLLQTLPIPARARARARTRPSTHQSTARNFVTCSLCRPARGSAGPCKHLVPTGLSTKTLQQPESGSP